MKSLIDELKNYKSICFYPSCGTDLSDLDFFCSGKMPIEERKQAVGADDWNGDYSEPDLYFHTDVNFYMEFESGEDLDLSEKCSLKDSLESLKYESSRKKIKKLLELYCKKDYKNFDKNKIAMSGYKMRSYIIHGKTIDEIEGIYDIAHKLKIITLDTFKEWSKKAVTN